MRSNETSCSVVLRCAVLQFPRWHVADAQPVFFGFRDFTGSGKFNSTSIKFGLIGGEQHVREDRRKSYVRHGRSLTSQTVCVTIPRLLPTTGVVTTRVLEYQVTDINSHNT